MYGDGNKIPQDPFSKELAWRIHVENEARTAKVFESKYGYMKGPLNKIIEDEIHLLVDKDRPRISDLIHEPVLSVEPLSKYIKVLPSPQPIPKTTNGMIGWRSQHPDYWLDRYGRYGRCKRDIIKVFNWPNETT
ncbi:unnamed protein product [Trichobilharzia regenti]|uniref:39S ribosomal protein L22, mitochondrial n=1 Tax=Trichobilharzia regenti TaxID=157069 RepID=A0A183VTM3_TRIRE|nr:unnamed protein product [Trichobilharzia regenti]VDP99708.1 unnamed protein product [Trichobilharzia regenti]